MRPAGIVTLWDDGRLHHVLQLLGVACRHLVDINQFVVLERLQLDEQYGRLDAVHARVHADADVVVTVAALTMDMVGVYELRPFIVIGEHGAAVAIAPHRLGGEERRGGDVAEGAGLLLADAASKALGTVFEDIETVLVGHLADGLEVGRQTEQVNGDDDARCQLTGFQRLLDFTLKVSHIHVEGVFVDVDEDGRSTLHGDDLGRGEEGEARDEDGIAGFDIPSLQGQQQGVGAAVAGDAMLHADVFGKSGFHLLDFRAHHIGR